MVKYKEKNTGVCIVRGGVPSDNRLLPVYSPVCTVGRVSWESFDNIRPAAMKCAGRREQSGLP